MSVTLRSVMLRLPMKRAFSTSSATLIEREVILVGLSEGEITGWGEAAPYPGYTRETITEAWVALRAWADGRPQSAHPIPTLTAALEQASVDLAAKRSGTALWRYLGGSGQPVSASAAVGIQTTIGDLVRRVDGMVAAGANQLKLKISPGYDLSPLRAVREEFPNVLVAADANGSYQPGDPGLDAIDGLGLAYVEQPFDRRALGAHAELRARWDTPVCLDEAAHTLDDLRRVTDQGAADLVSLKPGILGPSATLAAMDMAGSAGVGVKIGGLVETSVGRSHCLALASRPQVVHTDVIPAHWLLDQDPSPRRWKIQDGQLMPLDQHGVEVVIDRRVVVDEFSAAFPSAPIRPAGDLFEGGTGRQSLEGVQATETHLRSGDGVGH